MRLNPAHMSKNKSVDGDVVDCRQFLILLCMLTSGEVKQKTVLLEK